MKKNQKQTKNGTPKPKEKKPSINRIEAAIRAIKTLGETTTLEALTAEADRLYTKANGLKPNLLEAKGDVIRVIKFLKACREIGLNPIEKPVEGQISGA